MLARMWRKGNPLMLLVEMQASTAILENSKVVPQDVKNRATLQPRNCTTRYLPQRYRCSERRSTCSPMFIAAMFTIAKLWEELRCLSTDEWIKKMWFIYTTEYYPAIKK